LDTGESYEFRVDEFDFLLVDLTAAALKSFLSAAMMRMAGSLALRIVKGIALSSGSRRADLS